MVRLWKTDESLLDETNDQVYRVYIETFQCQAYHEYIVKQCERIRLTYPAFANGLRERAPDDSESDVLRKVRQILVEDSFHIYYEAYERWMKPVLDKAEEYGLVFEAKRIDFLAGEETDSYRAGEVIQAKLYVVAYVDAYLLNRFAEMLEGTEYGFKLDLAPQYIDYESASFNDPFFSH